MKLVDVQVEHYGGKNTINDPRKGLRALLGRTGFGNVVSIGLTRDTDFVPEAATAEASAFESVRSTLAAVGLPAPRTIGTPITGNFQNRDIQVNVLLLPGGGVAGMLESLCFEAAGNDPARPCVDEFLACVGKSSGRIHAANMLPKARIHAWLATFPEPDLRLGEAAQKGLIDFSHPIFDQLKAFLGSL